MKYTYAYKTSDGVRHEASMDAESREQVFAVLRAEGIKAIKVVAADGSKANGEVIVRGVRKRIVGVVVLLVACLAGVLAYRAGRSSRVVETSPRHWIAPVEVQLSRPGERLLACFVRPGVEIGERELPPIDDALVEDFEAVLNEPMRADSTDTGDMIEFKRVIEGLKAEACSHLRGGRSHEDVIRFFVQRQRTEAQLRRQLVERLGQAPKAELERRRREVSEMIETLGFQPLD